MTPARAGTTSNHFSSPMVRSDDPRSRGDDRTVPRQAGKTTG